MDNKMPKKTGENSGNSTDSSETARVLDPWETFLNQAHDHAVVGLPADFSVNHDHYFHGAPKRVTAP